MTDENTNQIGVKTLLSGLNQEFKEREVAEKAKTIGLDYVNLAKIPVNPDLLQIIEKKDSLEAGIFPFLKIGKKLRVAIIDPDNEKTKELIKTLENKGFELKISLSSPESLAYAQQKYESDLYYEEKEIIADEQGKIESIASEMASIQELPAKLKQLRSDEALNLLHIEILRLNASDLHLEPEKDKYRVRARVDGLLADFFELDLELAQSLIRQIKHSARLKLNVVNLPQDGKYSFEAKDRTIDVRVSILPTKIGESLVMRFLDPRKGLLSLEKLGFSERALKRFKQTLNSTSGLILVTGPTGSGKTTTLHSVLNTINDPERKIITIEDPVEFQIKGVVQCEVKEDEGFTFAAGLRSILRQDPDIVMVGEIRDKDTAETAVQASLTGHLVLSTLHTNSASAAIPRLLNMGIAPFVLAPALRSIVAQRLVRRLCKKCVQYREPTEAEKQEIEAVIFDVNSRGENMQMPDKIPVAQGCPECSETGYKGVIAIAEILLIDEELANLIYKNPTDTEILQLAKKKGLFTMWEEGILKVLKTETTLEEIVKHVSK